MSKKVITEGFIVNGGFSYHPIPRENLTKRELIAAIAMQGLLAGGNICGAKAVASTAIAVADELLKQLGNE